LVSAYDFNLTAQILVAIAQPNHSNFGGYSPVIAETTEHIFCAYSFQTKFDKTQPST